jgi:hypothetical protein
MKQSSRLRAYGLAALASALIACSGGEAGQGGAGGTPGAGGTSGTGGAGGNEEAFRLVNATPAADATDAEPDEGLSAVFSDALQDTTVTSSSFTLTDAQGVTIDGVVRLLDEKTVTFTPNERLALLTEYTATVSTEIENQSGSMLEADFSWRFTTRDGRWGTPERIDTEDSYDTLFPQTAIDPDGNAVAVWMQDDGSDHRIWASRYAPVGGWSPPESVDRSGPGDSKNPQVTIDSNGNGFAVWQRESLLGSVPPGETIWASRYTLAGGWFDAERIDPRDISNATNPQIAVDSAGIGHAVWAEDLGSGGIWWNRYTREDGWSFDHGIVAGGDSHQNPQIAVEPEGNALAVWEQSDGTRYDLWASRYTPESHWGSAERIEAGNAGDAVRPRVAVDLEGNVLAIWEQFDGVRWSIWANRYTRSGGWSAAQRVESNGAGDARRPQIAIDGSGNVVAVWIQSDGTRFNVWTNRYTPGRSWGTPELIETDNTSNASKPRIAVDPNRNALAVWEQSDGTRVHLWSNRYTQLNGWGTAEVVENLLNSSHSPQVAVDARGNGLVVWHQSGDRRTDIWANRFE